MHLQFLHHTSVFISVILLCTTPFNFRIPLTFILLFPFPLLSSVCVCCSYMYMYTHFQHSSVVSSGYRSCLKCEILCMKDVLYCKEWAGEKYQTRFDFYIKNELLNRGEICISSEGILRRECLLRYSS